MSAAKPNPVMMTITQSYIPRPQLHFTALCVILLLGYFVPRQQLVLQGGLRTCQVHRFSFQSSQRAMFVSAALPTQHATRHTLHCVHNVLPYPILQFYMTRVIIIIIIIIINCNWIVTRWQRLFYMYTKYEIGY